MNLGKSLSVIFGILLLYSLCVAWLWYQIGYPSGHFGPLFGVLTMLLNNLGFPIFFLLMVYKHRPKTVSGWWTLRAFVVCWVPLIINVAISHVVYIHLTGLYLALMTSTEAGAQEGIAVHDLLMYIQCVWLTIFMSLFMAWRSWWVRTYG